MTTRACKAALGEPGADAGDVVARLAERLGLPNRLRDAGVAREPFAEIADHAFHDPWTEAPPPARCARNCGSARESLVTGRQEQSRSSFRLKDLASS